MKIENYIEIAEKYAKQTNIIIVTNIKGITKNYDDYASFPVMYLSH